MSEKKSDQLPTQAQSPIVQPVTEITGPGSVSFVDITAVKIDNSIIPDPSAIVRLKEIGVWDDVFAMAKSRQEHEQAAEMQRLQNNTLELTNQREIALIEARSSSEILVERRRQRNDGMMVIGGLVAVGVTLILLGQGIGGLVSLLGAIGILLASLYSVKSDKSEGTSDK